MVTEAATIEETLEQCTGIDGVARIIRKDWKNVYFGAKPYLDAMSTGSTFSKEEMYGLDRMQSIVIYFLSNATAWRGDVARATKAFLKKKYGVK
jgi:hypothetical protein